MSQPESFGPIAPHYDLLMSHVPYDMWVAYYQLLLAQIGASPRRLLDVCCGTGNVAEILDDEGFEVTGFDLSEAMVSMARRKAKRAGKKIKYHVADAASLSLGQQFEGAYSFFDSLNYIIDPERLRSALKRIAAHLEPGGSLVFDVNTAYAFEQQMFDQKERHPRAPIRYVWRGDYDPATRLISVDMEFEKGGRTFSERHLQRAYTQEELMDYLAEAGFKDVQVFDSYTLNPPRRRSDRLHYAASL